MRGFDLSKLLLERLIFCLVLPDKLFVPAYDFPGQPLALNEISELVEIDSNLFVLFADAFFELTQLSDLPKSSLGCRSCLGFISFQNILYFRKQRIKLKLLSWQERRAGARIQGGFRGGTHKPAVFCVGPGAAMKPDHRHQKQITN